MAITLSRRTLLRGTGGAAVGLPCLEIMGARRAAAQTGKKMRYVLAFGGLSPREAFPPRTLGPGYELTVGLRPLGGRTATPPAGRPPYTWDSVRDAFNVVTNLRCPTSGPGSYHGPWHNSVVGPILSGVSSGGSSNPHPAGVTSDMVVARGVPATLRFRSLCYRVQPAEYRREGTSGSGIISHNGTSLVTPIQSPRAAYDQFFRDFAAPAAAGGGPDPAWLLAQKKNRSVLDLVSWRAGRLKARLGRPDLARLDEHFTQIREMERRLAQLAEAPPPPPTTACGRLADPGADPGTTNAVARDDPGNKGSNMGWSDEHKRALVMGDLVYLSLACDHARVVSWMFTYPQSFMSVAPIIGNRQVDQHDLGHGGGNADDMARSASWYVEHLARLADRLRKTREDESNLLDRTVIVFVMEGGTVAQTHSSERSAMLVGGGKEGGLVQGHAVDGRGRHHAHALVSAMQAAGAAATSLGEVTGRIDELHRA
jgi:hypothetical protein